MKQTQLNAGQAIYPGRLRLETSLQLAPIPRSGRVYAKPYGRVAAGSGTAKEDGQQKICADEERAGVEIDNRGNFLRCRFLCFQRTKDAGHARF